MVKMGAREKPNTPPAPRCARQTREERHIKSESCYRLRLLLTHRRNLKRKFLDLENAIRHLLRPSASASTAPVGAALRGRSAERLPATALVAELIDAMPCARGPSEKVLPAETW